MKKGKILRLDDFTMEFYFGLIQFHKDEPSDDGKGIQKIQKYIGVFELYFPLSYPQKERMFFLLGLSAHIML